MDADPYTVLGVKREASQDEIQKAYWRLAKKLHPDLNPGNRQAEERFKDVSAAWLARAAMERSGRGLFGDRSRPAPLIADLQRLGVNSEGIPIILDLIDQLHGLRRMARELLARVKVQQQERS